MKSAIRVFAILLVFVFAACDKEDVKLDTNSIPGTWKLRESYISNGAEGNWEKSKADLVVEFKADSSLAGNAYPEYVTYKVKDASTIVLFKKDNTAQNYTYALKDGTLSMSPSGPIFCIEGCGQRFYKIK
jgi:hypothetical protein